MLNHVSLVAVAACAVPLLPLAAQSTPSAARVEQKLEDSVSPRHVDLHGQSARIPFRVEPGGSRPIPVVEALIGGRGPYRFYFDTGASVCVVDSALARELALTVRGRVPLGDPSEKNSLEADAVWITQLDVADAEWRDVPAVAIDRSRFGAAEGIVGVLGLPLAEKHLLTVDYAAGELRLSDESLPESGAGIVPLVGDGPLPQVEMLVAGQPIRAHLDTGSPSGFTVPGSFAAGLAWKAKPIVIGRGGTVANTFEIKEAELDGTLVLAGHTFQAPRIRINDVLPSANIGREVLGRYTLALDQRNRRARFTPVPREATDGARVPAPRRLGLRLEPATDPVTVAGVDPGSLAETCGLRAGDVLVAIDGKPVRASDLDPLDEALRGSAAITIRIRRQGQERTVVVPAAPDSTKRG